MFDIDGLLAARTPKQSSGGSQRAIPPDETWRNVAPWLERVGVTRVANVTGLDHVGIPVWQAIRPNSRSLSVSQGKGIDTIAAKVSAVMESLESWCAERARCELRLASFSELGAEDAADPLTLPLDPRGFYDPKKALLWTPGLDLMGRRPIWVPFELVHVNTTVPSTTFLCSSNGLASGNTLAEAISHALCEVVERDANALFGRRSAEAQAATRVDLATASDPAVQGLLDQYATARLVPMVWNMTSDVGVATLRVIAFDADTDPLMNPMAAAYGAGCHVDRVTALIRGLTEAAQSRLSWIAGSRDDLDRAGSYDATQRCAVIEHHAALAAEPAQAAFEEVPTGGAETVEEDLALVLAHLRSIGVDRAIVVPIEHDGLPFAVVRVIVPGLEAPSTAAGYRPGKRAQAVGP